MKKLSLLLALLIILTACSDKKENTVETKEEVLETKETVLENKETVLENKETVLEDNKEVSESDGHVLEYSNERMKSTVTYYADGDDIYKEEVLNVLDFSEYSGSEEIFKERLEAQKSNYESVRGVEYDYNYEEGGKVTEKLVIDYKNLDIEAFNALNEGLIEVDLSEGISLKKTIEQAIEKGYKEVK